MSLIKELKTKLETLNYELIYPGFKQYKFALYDEEKVYFEDKEIPWDERFIGNTAKLYEGHYIAIWNLKSTVKDIDVFTSKIVHEMFHAHQLTNNETRFPNELKALHYTYNEENLSMKFDETKALLKGDILSFIQKRNFRATLYKDEVIYETRIEQVEGIARYVELQALKQLDINKYHIEVHKSKNPIMDITNYLPVRTISYEIGAFLFQNIHENNVLYDNSFDTKETLYEQINDQSSIIPYKYKQYQTDFIDEYYKKLNKTIKTLKKESKNQLSFLRITGLDPMNSFVYKNNIHYKHFIRVELPNKEMKYIMKESVSSFNEDNKTYTLYY